MTQNDTPLTEVSLILMNQSKLSSFSILHEKKRKQTNKGTNKQNNYKTPCAASEEKQVNKNKGSEVFAANIC